MQGPIHEAFAAPAESDRSEDATLRDQKPPENIDEQPPEVTDLPKGSVWVPGYWSWSDDVDKYVWVSGLTET